jgi:2-dehydro-3-deoxygluconokinase
VLHVTGITPALGDTARAAVERAIDIASGAGAVISLDLNYRSALWPQAEAASVLRELAARCHVLFATEDEAALLVGEAAPDVLLRRLAELGPAKVLLKRGAEGAIALLDGAEHAAAPPAVQSVDPVGAGDAFVAGYLSALLDGRDADAAMRRATAAGAFAVAADGDWEGLPSARELDELAAGRRDVTR